jgi:hypothetical protein
LDEDSQAALRAALVAHVATGGSTPSAGRRRRLALAAAVASLGLVGSAVGVGIEVDFLGEQERVDRELWTPPEYRPSGARVEVARGPDWAFMAWLSGRGVCVAWAAGSATNWARACGAEPLAGDTDPRSPEHLITALFSTSAGADGQAAVVGAVTASVRRVELELADGGTVAAYAEPAPVALATDARLFLARVPPEAFGNPTVTHFPIRAYVFYGPDGRELERYLVR